MSKADAIARIVIFADGTGNAFARQESNVWRLYEALDLTRPDQVALYIAGVGTSGFKPFAILDGATGLGVPSNVRELYRFLCWTWRPGVEIHLFGFSRGAFTIRTLIGLVATQGLVPTKIDGAIVSRAAMRRNAMAAWRAYRAQTAGRGEVSLLITATRGVRDAVLAMRDRLAGHKPYAALRAATAAAGRDAVRIRFAGLFDTVEAYGVPINELRAAIDRMIWPVSFRNRVLSDKVDTARHALSLDDERTTFHPVRFDMRSETVADHPRIREVWFAGVHSDVGGGYPDDALAAVPLAWMMTEAIAAGPPDGAIRFRAGALEAVQAGASPLAAAHDSRAGVATLYRYAPRPIAMDPASGGPPIVHHSVAEKMVFGPENYAPVVLPTQARVLLPDGSLHPIDGFPRERAAAAGPVADTALVRDHAAAAVARLARPNASYAALTRDVVWGRKAVTLLLFTLVLAAVLLPLTAPALDRSITAGMAAAARRVGLSNLAAAWRQRLLNAQGGLGSNLGQVSATVGGFIPGYAKGWVQALVDQPLSAALILAATGLVYAWTGWLRDRCADLARCAWFIDERAARPSVAPSSLPSRFARAMRTSSLVQGAGTLLATRIVPAAALLVLAFGAVVLVERTVVTYRGGSGALCRGGPVDAVLRDPKEGVANRAEPFDTADPCWGTGILVRQGRTYALFIAMPEAALDGDAVTGLAGYTGGGLRAALALPFRRRWDAAWQQPIAKIGSTGSQEWPLQSADGAAAVPLAGGTRQPGAWQWDSPCAKAESTGAPPPEAASALARSFVATFTAQASGELFVFVNDALGAVPLGPLLTCAYDNNRGLGQVTVELLPAPTVPAAQPYDFSAAR